MLIQSWLIYLVGKKIREESRESNRSPKEGWEGRTDSEKVMEKIETDSRRQTIGMHITARWFQREIGFQHSARGERSAFDDGEERAAKAI